MIIKKYQDHLEDELTILSKSNLQIGKTESNILFFFQEFVYDCIVKH